MSDLLWNPGSWRRHFLHFLKCVAAFFSEQSNSRGFTFSVASLRERNTYLLCAHFLLNKNMKIRRPVSCRAKLKTTTTNERETVCQTKLSWPGHGNIHPGIHYGHVAACVFRPMSTTWAPSGHQHASVLCLSPILLQKVADVRGVGCSWSELSKLATFLLRLKGKMGHTVRQQLGPKRDATNLVVRNDSLLHVITSRNYFQFFFSLSPSVSLITVWNDLAAMGANYFS